MTAEILALLETGPQPQDQLLAWLGADEAALRHELKRLKAAGEVKRTGVDDKWALASYVAPNGRRPADRTPLDAEILAALASGPKPRVVLRSELRRKQTVVIEALRRLERAGRVKRVRTKQQVTAWALATYDGPEPIAARPPRRTQPLAPRTTTPHAGAEKPWRAPGLHLDRPEPDPPRPPAPSTTVPGGPPLAWWTTAKREGFTAEAAKQFDDHMRQSRDHLRLQLRMLQ